MNSNPCRFYLYLIVLLALALVYVLYTYQATLNKEVGFLYHPETDRIYEVELSAWVGHETLSRRLMPWTEVHYGVTGIGEPLGRLTEILELIEEDQLLKETDHRLWLERRGESARKILEDFGNQNQSVLHWGYIDVAYLIRTDIDKSEQLIQLIPGIVDYSFEPSKYMLTVDAFLAERSGDPDTHDLEALAQAVLIRGRSAAYLKYLGVNDPFFSNVNP